MLKIIGSAVVIGSGSVGLDACTASGARPLEMFLGRAAAPPRQDQAAPKQETRSRRVCRRESAAKRPLTRVADVAGVQGMSNAVAFTDVQRLPPEPPSSRMTRFRQKYIDLVDGRPGKMASASGGSPCLAQRLPTNQRAPERQERLVNVGPLVISHP